MTAKTSQHLADVLRAAGFDDLAVRAEADEFHDFLSPHALPETMLAEILADYAATPIPAQRIAAMNIRQRLIDGEFDASDEESDEWAASPEGQETFGKLVRGE
jgi:hypothetical protein